jgi:hypothetical protein
VRIFGTLTVDGFEALFTSGKGAPVVIANVFKVTVQWSNQKYGEPTAAPIE